MTKMLYKHGGDSLVWGKKMSVKAVTDYELLDHLNDGWVDHPSKVVDPNSATVTGLASQLTSVGESKDDAADKGEISDGYHTFNDLYAHRVRLFSTLMKAFPGQSWWSFCDSAGKEDEGWILAGIDTPEGAVTYHLPETEIPYLPAGTEIEFGKDWDGHTPEDCLIRLASLELPAVAAIPEQPPQSVPEESPQPDPEQGAAQVKDSAQKAAKASKKKAATDGSDN